VLELTETTILDMLIAREGGEAAKQDIEDIMCRLMAEAADALTYVHAQVCVCVCVCVYVCVCVCVWQLSLNGLSVTCHAVYRVASPNLCHLSFVANFLWFWQLISRCFCWTVPLRH
jgi:hypothetical protein